jgi:hypothetical protein
VGYFVRSVTMLLRKGVTLSESDPSPAQARTPSVEQIVARVQTLCDTRKPEGRYPLATCVEGYFLGDITAIVTAAIRSEHLLER